MTPKPADVARDIIADLDGRVDWIPSDKECEAMARVVLAAEALYEALDEHQVDSPEAHALARALDGEE